MHMHCSNDDDAFCLRFHAASRLRGVHGAKQRWTGTWRIRWHAKGASIRAADFQISNEQPLFGSCLCGRLCRPDVQGGRHDGLDVSSMWRKKTLKQQMCAQWVSNGVLATDDTCVLLLRRDGRSWVPQHAGQCHCDDRPYRWWSFASSSYGAGCKAQWNLPSLPSLPGRTWPGTTDETEGKHRDLKCRSKWNYQQHRDAFRVFWIRKPSTTVEEVFAHIFGGGFWPGSFGWKFIMEMKTPTEAQMMS